MFSDIFLSVRFFTSWEVGSSPLKYVVDHYSYARRQQKGSGIHSPFYTRALWSLSSVRLSALIG